MTMIFKLQNGDSTAAGNVVDLLNTGATGFGSRTWAPRIATPLVDRVPAPVVETIETQVRGSNQDNLAQHVQQLHDMQRWTDQYMSDRQYLDGVGVGPVWLHSKMNNETGERRALVRSLDAVYARDVDSDFYGGMVETNNLMEMGLAVERGPYWEKTTSSTGSQTSGLDSVGGLYDYTTASATNVPGDVPARIEKLEVWADTTAMSYIWAGFRSAGRHTDPAMLPTVPLPQFSMGIDATGVADPTACEATNVTVNFASATGWTDRLTGTHGLAAGPYDVETGLMLLLLRAQVTSGASCEVRVLRHNTAATEDAVYSDPVRINASAWTIYPIGYHNNGGRPTITVQARRLSTAGSLYLDRMVMLPVDEYFLYAEGNSIIGGPVQENGFHWTVRADDTLLGYSDKLAKFTRNVAQSGAGVPPGDGRMVVVAARANRVSYASDNLTMKLSHFPRYVSLRGAD